MSTIAIFGIFFAIFAVIIVWLGIASKKWVSKSSDYIIAGREVSLLVNIFGVAAIGYAGTLLTLGPAFTLLFGLTKGFFLLGIPFAIMGYISYGLIVTPIARRSGAQTSAEWMELRFDKRVRVLIVITSVIAMIGITANNVRAVAEIVHGMTMWSTNLMVLSFFVVYLVFVVVGGLWGVTITDVFQGMIILIALPLIAVLLISLFGGFSGVVDAWPAVWSSGVTGSTAPWISLRYPSVLTGIFLFMIALVWGSNHYWIRVSSSRSERSAKWSFIIAGVICGIAATLYGFLGAYMGAFHLDKFTLGGGTIPPVGAFGVFLGMVPPIAGAFLLLAAVAASLSTGATTHIAGSSLLIRDVFQRFLKPNATDKETLKFSRMVTFLFGVVCLALCYFPGGPVYLFAFACAFLAPPAMLVILGMFWRRINSNGAFAGSLTGIIAMSVWTFLDLTKIYPMSQKFGHYVIPGLVVTFVIAVIVSYITKPEENAIGASLPDELTDEERKVLEIIRKGYNTMAEINDMLKIDCYISKEYIAKLEYYNYINRFGNGGKNYYTFNISEKGLKALPPLSEKEKSLLTDNIDETGIKVLLYVQENPNIVADELTNVTGMEVLASSNVIASLIRRGYLKEGGLWKRKVEISDGGSKLLEKYRMTA